MRLVLLRMEDYPPAHQLDPALTVKHSHSIFDMHPIAKLNPYLGR